MNLSKVVDAPVIEMRRAKKREEWGTENQAALSERCKLLEAEGGTAAERFYGVLPSHSLTTLKPRSPMPLISYLLIDEQ